MRELVDIGAKFQSNRAALEELHQKVVQGNQVVRTTFYSLNIQRS